jgi:hypothetical protein
MYTICRGNKTVSVKSDNKDYIIGFNKILIAKSVQYNIHPEPKIILLRSNIQKIKKEDLSLSIDNDATLFIEKHNGCALNPINDGGYHINTTKIHEFMLYPYSKNIGVVLPYDLIDENENEFIFKSFVIDAPEDTDYFKL